MKKILSLLFLAALILVMMAGCTLNESVISSVGLIGYGNIVAALIVALLIIVCVLLLQTKYKAQAAKILLYLVTTAEQEFGSGTGQLKYSAVVTWLYEKLPSLAKLVLRTSTINNLIESAVTEMKEYLQANAQAKALVETTEVETTTAKVTSTEKIESEAAK